MTSPSGTASREKMGTPFSPIQPIFPPPTSPRLACLSGPPDKGQGGHRPAKPLPDLPVLSPSRVPSCSQTQGSRAPRHPSKLQPTLFTPKKAPHLQTGNSKGGKKPATTPPATTKNSKNNHASPTHTTHNPYTPERLRQNPVTPREKGKQNPKANYCPQKAR